jgi:small subunit ribosomal protein S18
MSEIGNSEGTANEDARKPKEDSSGAREGEQSRQRESGQGRYEGGRPGGQSRYEGGRFGGRGRDRGDRDSGGRRGGGRFRRQRRKVCAFCVDKVKRIDYKDHPRLRDFVSDRGKILKSRMTGTCMKHQRKLAVAIKRARQVALLPFVAE